MKFRHLFSRTLEQHSEYRGNIVASADFRRHRVDVPALNAPSSRQTFAVAVCTLGAVAPRQEVMRRSVHTRALSRLHTRACNSRERAASAREVR